MHVVHVEALLHRTNDMEGASLDVEAMENGRSSVEEEKVWKKSGGYGEVGGESLEGASRRRNSI